MVPSYGQFCPVSKAAEVLCERWAILVVREALAGSVRFGDLQRGLPGCPPATLSKRLKDLTRAGVLTRTEAADGIRYELTEAGWELYPIVEGFGRWGQRWARSEYEPEEEVLLWDVRHFLDPATLGVEQAVVQLEVRVPAQGTRRFWITVDPGEVDLCLIDPGRPIDAIVDADLAALTRVWMGDDTFAEAVDAGSVSVRGPAKLVRQIPEWFGQHPVLGPIAPANGG